jgi:hypothetical protein
MKMHTCQILFAWCLFTLPISQVYGKVPDTRYYEVRSFSLPYRTLIQEAKVKAHSVKDEYVRDPHISIGFHFQFGAAYYETVSVHENGFLSLGSDQPKGTAARKPVSNRCSESMVGIIAACGADLYPMQSKTAGTSIRSGIFGAAPHRVLVVEWARFSFKDSTGKGSTGDTLTFQIQLHELGNKIRIQYGPCTWTSARPQPVEIGIQGNIGPQPSTNTTDPKSDLWKQLLVVNGNATGLFLQNYTCPTEGTVIEFCAKALQPTMEKAHKPTPQVHSLPPWWSRVHKVLLALAEGATSVLTFPMLPSNMVG